MVELFRIGHFGIYLFGITIALGMIVGITIMMSEAKRKHMQVDKLVDMVTYTILVSLIGARLYYVVAFNSSYYLSNPIEILYVRDGGLSIQGALIFGISFAYWYAKRKGISFWKAADACAPGIIIGQAIGRIGCDVFGIPMKKEYPWGIMINTQLLHPAQMYEALLDLALFIYLWRRRNKVKYNGEIFVRYNIGFAIIRFIVEFFRTNPIIIGPFTIAHVTSVVIIIIMILVEKIITKRKIIELESDDEELVIPLWHYILILIITISSIWFYYFIH